VEVGTIPEMPMKIDEADCTAEAILTSFVKLELPNANNHDFASQDGRRLYLDAWRELEKESTALEHKLAVHSALGKRDSLSPTVTKVSKFAKRSREFASRAIAVYEMFDDVLQARNDDPRAFIWLFGKPNDVRKHETAVNRKMSAAGDKIIKEYDRFWHERELLLTQIQVVAPQLASLIRDLR
jgi:hypothetical protein